MKQQPPTGTEATESGLTPEQAEMFQRMGVTSEMVIGPLPDAIGFVSATEWHGLSPDDVQELLREAGGDPQAAWEKWAEDSPDW